MKKGVWWPQARARWVNNSYDGGAQNCPVWLYPFQVGLVYIDYVLDIPVPIFINHLDMTPAQWSYRPSDGAIVWHGTWNVGFNSGDWWFTQRQSGGEFVYRAFEASVEVAGVTSYITLNNTGEQSHGDWYRFPASLAVCDTVERWFPPWLPTGSGYFQPQTYKEIYAGGIDPNDLAPVTWNFTGPP